MTFAIGPAGTGKTYLAVATAVRALQEHQVSRLILTRPAVEAGERLGFLPGTLYEKIDPYMRPLYDALFEMTGADTLSRLMERGTVEVAPLAYMRGRTLNDAFIILDEAQNTTPEQMKMFLTRIGFGSKAVVNGDSTQTDLQTGQASGLAVVQEILDGIDGHRSSVTWAPGTWCVTRSCKTSWRPTVASGSSATRRRRASLTSMSDDDGSPSGGPDIQSQDSPPVDEAALTSLARVTLDRRRSSRQVELSLSFVDEDRDGRPPRPIHGRGGTDRRAVVPVGRVR